MSWLNNVGTKKERHAYYLMFGTRPNINQSSECGKEEKQNACVVKLSQQRKLQAF